MKLQKQQVTQALSTLAMIALTACGAQKNSSSTSLDSNELNTGIVNGTPVKSQEDISRSTVDLYITIERGPQTIFTNFCSGTLIAPDTVITAGHCIEDLKKELEFTNDDYVKSVQVGFGSDIATSPKDQKVKFRKLRAVQAHPEYFVGAVEHADTVAIKDIAMLKLAEVAPQGFVPALLPAPDFKLKKGQVLTLAGFGLTDGIKQTPAKSLNKVNVTIDEPDFSATQFAYSTIKGQTACNGDSGGPAYFRNPEGKLVVLGATSWGDNRCKQMGVYTSTIALLPWIEETMKSL